MIQAAVSLLLGYLLGGIPTGVVVARAYGRDDLTRVGSGKTGATNVLRTLGKGPAALVFVGDFLKACAAVLLAGAFFPGDDLARSVAGAAAVIGHAYSPYIGFKGGRGVVTGLGGLLLLWWPAGLTAIVVGVLAIAATRYVSLGSVLGTAVGSLALLVGVVAFAQPAGYVVFAAVVGIFIIVAHRDNINRLLHGTERRLGQRVK